MLTHPSGDPLSAKLVIVGARPGKHEVGLCPCSNNYHAKGIPLVGPSGNLLWNTILPFRRKDCYVTNVRRDYNPKAAVPTADEIREALPSLQEELSATQANVIVALGREALVALTNRHSIDNWRGSILESTLLPGRKVVATYHPAAALRVPQWRYIIQADMRRALAESEYPEIRPLIHDFLINAGLDESVEFLRGLEDPISVDVETFGNDVACIGIGDSITRAGCFPFINSVLSESELVLLWKEINRILRSRRILGQNISFDIEKLENHGFEPGDIEMDTMLAHHLLWPELGMASKTDDGTEKFAGSHDLAFLTSIYTKEPYYKHLSKEWRRDNDWQKFWTYNCLDVICTYQAYLGLLAELVEFNQLEYYRKHVNALIKPVMRMQSRGMLVDRTLLTATAERTQLEVDYLQLQLNHMVGFNCNVRSVKDLRYLISDALKLTTAKTTKKGMISTDEDTLRNLAFDSPHANIFSTIIEIRKRRTLKSSFLQMETDEHGRYSARYKIHGTDSGRLSSVSPRKFENRKGPQLQNIPYQARKIFIAGPGQYFVVADLRRAEAMFVAYDSGDEDLIAAFTDPTRDLYREEAAHALSKSINDIDDVVREIFKRSTHAVHYGMRELRFISVLRLRGINIEDVVVRGIYDPKKKAKYILDSYLDRHPKIREWQDEIWNRVRRTRMLCDGLERKRFFLGRKDDHMRRVALSFRPQATIGGITNLAVTRLDAEGWNIFMQLHDATGLEVPEDKLYEGIVALEDALTCPIQLNGRTMIIPAEVKFGKNWGKLDGVVDSRLLEVHRKARSSRTIPSMDRTSGPECSGGP